MCCNTKPGPRRAISYLSAKTGLHLTQRDWHHCRAAAEAELGRPLSSSYADAETAAEVATGLVEKFGGTDAEKTDFIRGFSREKNTTGTLDTLTVMTTDGLPEEVVTRKRHAVTVDAVESITVRNDSLSREQLFSPSFDGPTAEKDKYEWSNDLASRGEALFAEAMAEYEAAPTKEAAEQVITVGKTAAELLGHFYISNTKGGNPAWEAMVMYEEKAVGYKGNKTLNRGDLKVRWDENREHIVEVGARIKANARYGLEGTKEPIWVTVESVYTPEVLKDFEYTQRVSEDANGRLVALRKQMLKANESLPWAGELDSIMFYTKKLVY